MLNNNNSIIIKLFFISIFSVNSVILVYIFTKSKIIFQTNNYQKKVLDAVLPKKFSRNSKISCYLIHNKLLGDDKDHKFWTVKKNKNLIAVIFEAIAPDGYSGDIKIIVSLNLNNTILGVRVLEHHETPGLGDKIDIHISDWISKFSGITVLGQNDPHFLLRKYGGVIDQFTGATITPLSIINAIKRIVNLFKETTFKNLNFKHCEPYHE
ncbi:MAG: electron transport complex subunit RsxG [Buchnera aphidicola (Nurudea shiraii)]